MYVSHHTILVPSPKILPCELKMAQLSAAPGPSRRTTAGVVDTRIHVLVVVSLVLALLSSCRMAHGFVAVPKIPTTHNKISNTPPLQMSLSPEELSKQKGEALQALADFNDGTWSGVATSFSITSDAAAGVSRRKFAVPYKTSVSTRFGFGEEEGLKVVETFNWEEESANNDEGKDAAANNDNGFCVASRTILLGSSMDVDAEDGSYSTDVALLDLPSAISGTKALTKFAIENCIAISDDERVRVFLLYGIDDLLSRVVICDEKRVEEELKSEAGGSSDVSMSSASGDQPPSFDVRNPITASTSIDERMERLQEAFAGSKQGGSGGSSASQYERYSMDLYGLSIGAWLGDTVVRDMQTGGSSSSGAVGSGQSSKGFGSPQSTPKKKKKTGNGADFGSGFAEWNLGVQKISIVFKWDFEETVRQVLHFGRSIGAATGPVPTSSMGTVNDELMSRRLPKEERMTYIDYDMSRYAGFIVGEKYIKCPRYLSFAQAESFPFFTELLVFLREKKDENDLIIELGDEDELPGAFCSRMSRLYDKDGNFAQGSTSFFMLKPIGGGDDQ